MSTKQMKAIILAFTLGMSMNTYAGLFGFGGDSWKEEVLLYDSGKIFVTRTIERGGRREIGQQPPVKEESLIFTFPGTDEHVTWKGNPPDKPKDREVEFSKKEVLREEVKIYGQPDHCCPQAC